MIKGLKNVNLLTPQGIIKGSISIKKGKIASLEEAFEGIEFNEDVYVIPGFIDEHIHGVNQSDVMDSTINTLRNISQSLAKEGTTSYLATTMTQSFEQISNALTTVNTFMNNDNKEGAELLGVHLEGPFINIEAKGAQIGEHVVKPCVETFKKYQEVSGNHIKYVTLAPEIDGGYELIRYLSEQKIIASIGHTKANYEQTLKAIHCGATHVTHCYNAMTPLHHRDLGVVGGALLHNELMAELIVDGIHVHPKTVQFTYKNKTKEHITLITDSMRAKGLEDGDYELGGQKVIVKNKEARLENGTLAGSVLKMIDAINNMMNYTDCSLMDVVTMASVNPAKKLNVYDRKGSIEVGKDADLVVLNSAYEILMTICRGEIAFIKEK